MVDKGGLIILYSINGFFPFIVLIEPIGIL